MLKEGLQAPEYIKYQVGLDKQIPPNNVFHSIKVIVL